MQELQKKRHELYTGEGGIGRRKKKARPSLEPELAPQDPTNCPICLDEIRPDEAVRTSFCHPKGHSVHKERWSAQTERQRERCSLCRQRAINPILLLCLYFCFATESREFNPELLLQNPDLSWFNHAGVGIAKSFARGEISEHVFLNLTEPANSTRDRYTRCASIARTLRGM